MTADRHSTAASCSRRHFLCWTATAATAVGCAGATTSLVASDTPTGAPQAKAGLPLKLGMASYTLRKFDLDKTLAMTKRAGLQYICLKSFHLPLEAKPDEIAAAAAMVARAGLTLYGGGVITMQKPAQVDQAFEYAKAAGMKVIVAAPSAEMLPAIEQKVKQYDLVVAIHNHGPGDKHFPTPASIYEKVQGLDKRIGLCMDIGHTVRIGADLIASTRKYADRLYDVHCKDITEASPKGRCIQLGRGVIDIPKFLRTLLEIKYAGVVSYEYEEEADDPLPGVAECVGYTHGVLAMV